MQFLIAPKNFHIIGRLLAFENPSLADSLFNKYQSEKKIPSETDLKKIEPFFLLFCVDQNIIPSEHRGAQYKRTKVDKQRLFISVMIQIYTPHLLDSVNKNLYERKGLAKKLSLTLGQDKGNISRMIDQVISTHNVYDDFREESERIVSVLIKMN